MSGGIDSFSARKRGATLAALAQEGVDILVIGGGITGAFIALDAAVRGYRVGLVEKADFASGTSSRSTKLAHGGIRYLPQFDFALVQEALTERGLLFQNAPWLVHPLAFVLPVYRWNKRPLGTPIVPPGGVGLGLLVRSGLFLYDLLAGRLNVGRHRALSTEEVQQRAPALRLEEMRDAFLYFDGQTDDSRLTLTVLKTAVRKGARPVNYAAVTGFDIADEQGGQIRAAHVRDTVTGETYTIPTRHVINAGGVFAQRIEELTGRPSQITVEPAKGVHLVVSQDRLPMTEDAIVLPETDDGRLLFLVPWGGNRVLIGTTDTTGGEPDRPATTEEDVAYLLDHCSRYLQVQLTPADVIGTYSGYRPLIRSKASDAGSAKLSRSHAVLDGPAGMISVVGGKLTTARRMAEDALDHIAKREHKTSAIATRDLPLEGTQGWSAKEMSDHLGKRYGARRSDVMEIARKMPNGSRRIVPDLPYLLAEVVYACRYEMAVTLEDVMSRRTHLIWEDQEQGRGVAREIAEIMAQELGWDRAQIDQQLATFYATIDQEYREQAMPIKATERDSVAGAYAEALR